MYTNNQLAVTVWAGIEKLFKCCTFPVPQPKKKRGISTEWPFYFVNCLGLRYGFLSRRKMSQSAASACCQAVQQFY